MTRCICQSCGQPSDGYACASCIRSLGMTQRQWAARVLLVRKALYEWTMRDYARLGDIVGTRIRKESP
jgi:hypothetical protein